MLVDSQMQPSLFAPPFADYSQDLNDIFHTELFSAPSGSGSSSGSSSGSRESTPHLLTPPQSLPAASFPDINDPTGSPTPSFFNFLDEDVKALDPLAMLSSAPYDFFGAFASMGGGGGGGGATAADLMNGIDPQLVGSPAQATYADFDSESQSSNSTSPTSSASPPADPVITPVKVGGHGKARKGTVATGGIKKASATAPNKENTSATNFSSTAFMPSTTFKPRAATKGDDDDDDDDLPADWRPPPEVFQKMSSKEKRQLRNKISARNFRVRRKEYISTLEDNIAERDRLLSAIRAELGSSQNENLALRQEIAALKRSLLDNRGPAPVLPAPKALPPLGSGSPTLSASSPSLSASSPSGSSGRVSPLPRANPLKDVGASGAFWGGAAHNFGGGYTSVRTARIPELLGANPFASSPFATEVPQQAPVQQENINPAMNGGPVAEVMRAGFGLGAGTGEPGAAGFGDANPFTVRNLDAYRMHLWGRMAAQYRYNKEHPAPPSPPSPSSSFSSGSSSSGFSHSSSSGFAPSPFAPKSLAGGMRPKYFASPTLPALPHASTSGSSIGGASGLAASLVGLSLSGKGRAQEGQRERERERERQNATQRERERETAMYAALASQTLLRRLGGAFWEAFSGAAPSGPGASGAGAKWDAEKVRKVLEGKAVVRVVDVEPPTPVKEAPSPRPAGLVLGTTLKREECGSSSCRLLEESMRSLTLGKKSA